MKKKLIYFFSMLVVGSMIFYSFKQFKSFQIRAREKEAITLLGSLVTAVKATETVLGKIPESFVKDSDYVSVGFAPVRLMHSKIVTNPSQLPQTYRNIIPSTMVPFVEENNYRFLSFVEPGGNKVIFFSVDRSGKFQRFESEIPIL